MSISIHNKLHNGDGLVTLDECGCGDECWHHWAVEGPLGKDSGTVGFCYPRGYLIVMWFAYRRAIELGAFFPCNLMLDCGEFRGGGSAQPKINEFEVVEVYDAVVRAGVQPPFPHPWAN